MSSAWTVRPSIRIAAILVAVLALAVLAAQVLARSQRRSTEAEFARTVAPLSAASYASLLVPDERNAALQLRKGALGLRVGESERAAVGAITTTPEVEWGPSERKLVRRTLAANADPIAALYRSGGLVDSGFGLLDPAREREDLRAELPVQLLLWAQRLLLLDAEEAWGMGDRPRFAAAVAAMSSLATALQREAPLLACMAGVAAEKMLLSEVARTLGRPDCDLAAIALLTDRLPRQDLSRGWRRTVANEAMQAQLTDDAAVAGASLGWLERIADDRARRRRLNLFAAVAAAIEIPVGSTDSWRAERDAEVGRWSATPPPNLIEGVVRLQSTLAVRQLAHAALWARAEGLRAGVAPESLAACPGAGLPDPFSGRPLSYRRNADGSATLAVERGDDLWRLSLVRTPAAAPFTWRLPPPIAP
jgi:hypothetical protein